MASERYIVIPNWDELQHYKGKARPAWIKLYPRLLRHDEFLKLTPPQRMALIGIWMLYAESARRVRLDTAWLSRALDQRISKRTLDALNHAGFIEFRSREALDELYAREEKRRIDTPYPHEVGNGRATPRASGQNPRALGTNPRAVAKRSKVELHENLLALARSSTTSWPAESTDRLHDRLDELEREHGGIFTDQERQTLIDDVLTRKEIPF